MKQEKIHGACRFFFPKADSFAFVNRKVPNTKLIFLKKYSLKQQI